MALRLALRLGFAWADAGALYVGGLHVVVYRLYPLASTRVGMYLVPTRTNCTPLLVRRDKLTRNS